HFGFFNLLGVLWNMVKSEVTVRLRGYDPVMREVADQNTTLANLGLGPIKSKAVRKAERLAEKAAREAGRQGRPLGGHAPGSGAQPALMFRMVDPSEATQSGCGSPRPSLTGKTAHALNQRMRSQAQDKAPHSVAHPAMQES